MDTIKWSPLLRTPQQRMAVLILLYKLYCTFSVFLDAWNFFYEFQVFFLLQNNMKNARKNIPKILQQLSSSQCKCKR